MDPVLPTAMAATMRRRFLKINPATGQPVREYDCADPKDIDSALHRAKTAFSVWRETDPKKRAAVLASLRNMLYERANEAAALICEETGKPWTDAMEADIGPALSILSYYTEIGPHCLKPRLIRPDLVSLLAGRSHRETCLPRGVIGIIAPWNYPLGISTSGVAAALMAGNVVLLKPSEHAPATGQWLIERCREALVRHSLPPDVAQVLCGDGSTGAALAEAELDGMIFTGSARTGGHIRSMAERQSRWVSLELGGSDAMLVLPGCSLEKAASYAIWGRFTNAGQACASTKRLFAPESVQAELISLLRDKMAQLRVGVHIGPLISEAQRALLDAQVQDALQRGAKLLAGGRAVSGPGWYYEPTLLSDVPEDARVLREETFGPVLPIVAYRDVETAIHRMNDSPFGLTASIFGPEASARAIAPRLECATVLINDVGPANYAMACAPWGGWKESGSGVSHGERALLELSRRQVVSVNHAFRIPGLDKPLWQFSKNPDGDADRTRAILAFCARHPHMWRLATWLAFWRHRSSKKI